MSFLSKAKKAFEQLEEYEKKSRDKDNVETLKSDGGGVLATALSVVDDGTGSDLWSKVYDSMYNSLKNYSAQNTPTKSYSNVNLSKYSSGFSPSKYLSGIKGQSDAANEAIKKYPNFTYARQEQLDKALTDYMVRKEFSYDVNADALYKQYEDKYMNGGKVAMQDAMGQAQAATGGFGNSYAATVGNQAYQSYVKGLTDVIPELEQRAYNKYVKEGEDMYNKYAVLADDRATAYGEYLTDYEKALADRDYYNSLYNNEYNKEYGEYTDQRAYDYNKYWDDVSFGYQKDMDSLKALTEALVGNSNEGGSAGTKGESTSGKSESSDVKGEDRSVILDKIAKTLSNDAILYDGQAAKKYIDELLYAGTITSEEAKYLWNMSGVGVLTGTNYDPISDMSVAAKKFKNNTNDNGDYSQYTVDKGTVEREIKRQYDKGLLSEAEIELLYDYYGFVG